MMKTKPVSARDLPQNAVVQDYLDSMLRSATEDSANDSDRDHSMQDVRVESPALESALPDPEIAANPETVKTETVAEDTVDLPREVGSEIVAPMNVEQLVMEQDQKPDTGDAEFDAGNQPLEIEQDLLPELTRAENGRPDWAQSEFECLLFTVDDLTLASPLVELGGIVMMNNNLTPIFAQPDWFMGILRWNGRNIRGVDTAKLVAQEEAGDGAVSPIAAVFLQSNAGQGNTDSVAGQSREDETSKEAPASNENTVEDKCNTGRDYRFVILIQGTDWGLAVNTAREVLRLSPDDVKWRVNVKAQPWFAGTVVEKMCALIDVNAFGHDLYQRKLDG